jgi:Uma2 family endonuclease
MIAQEKTFTAQEFREFTNRPENAGKWFEFINGVIYEAIMPKPIHAIIALRIAHFMLLFVGEHHLGEVVGDGCEFSLPNGDVVIPDAAFVSKEKHDGVPEEYLIAPDLAVEVISPSNRPREMLNKIESYIKNGTRIVWVVYPDEKVVDVWQPAGDGGMLVHKVTLDGTLEGGNVLPGFTLAVKDIFSRA